MVVVYYAMAYFDVKTEFHKISLRVQQVVVMNANVGNGNFNHNGNQESNEDVTIDLNIIDVDMQVFVVPEEIRIVSIN